MSDENTERRDIQNLPSVRSMRTGFDSLFDTFRSEFDDMMNFWWPLSPNLRSRPTTVRPLYRIGYPMSDIEDKGTHYELKADLPGVSKNDIDIKVTEEGIEISGKQEEKNEETSSNFLLRERRWSSFTRSFSFPEPVLPKKAEAEMKNGILRVKVPKKEPKTTEVHSVKIK